MSLRHLMNEERETQPHSVLPPTFICASSDQEACFAFAICRMMRKQSMLPDHRGEWGGEREGFQSVMGMTWALATVFQSPPAPPPLWQETPPSFPQAGRLPTALASSLSAEGDQLKPFHFIFALEAPP